jgi:hypothetical protein
VKSKGANDQQRCTPFYPHTNTEISACYQSFPIQQCATIGALSYKKLVKPVNNVLEGHMFGKNPRKQMTNRDVPHFLQTKTPNPNWKDGVTLTFSIPRKYIYYWYS